jgi:hypothetical protein
MAGLILRKVVSALNKTNTAHRYHQDRFFINPKQTRPFCAGWSGRDAPVTIQWRLAQIKYNLVLFS